MALGIVLVLGACGAPGGPPALDDREAAADLPEDRPPADVSTSTGVAFPAGPLGAAAGPPLASPLPMPPCTYADVTIDAPRGDEWATTLVDTTFALPRSYRAPDLVAVSRAGIAGSGEVRQIVIDDLRSLAKAARAAGLPLAVRSAYRSFTRQAAVFDGWVALSGHDEALRFSARPGHSEHQLGTAIDLQAVGGPAPWRANFERTREGRWLARNAWRFGFVVSYPPGSEAVTCYGPEAWHVRFVGREIARSVHRSGLTLREWLWLNAG